MSSYSFSAADTINLMASQGNTFRFPLRLKDLKGQIMSFTGDELSFTIKNRLEQTVLSLTNKNDGIELTEFDSLLTLFAAPWQMAKLPVGDYSHTLKRTQYNGEEQTLVKGKFKII